MPSEVHTSLGSLAVAAAEFARVPYSGRAEAVVLVLEDGAWIPGVRVETASFSLTIPPLLNALTTAVALGRTDIVAVTASRAFTAAERAYASANPFLQDLRPYSTELLIDADNVLPDPGERLSPFLSDGPVASADEGIAMARDVARRAHVPESGFPVGCVAQVGDRLLPGVNVEHPDWSYILCAERNVLGTCVSYGIPEVSAVWLSCLNDEKCTPCGACRQLFVELAPTAALWMDRGDLPPSRCDPSSLLPGSFGGEHLASRT